MRRLLADGWSEQPLHEGWELTGTAPGAVDGPGGLGASGWVSAPVPGGVAEALRDEDPRLAALDDHDWWYRTTLLVADSEPGARQLLWLDGLATFAEVYLDGRPVLESDSMFTGHALPIALDPGNHELTICLRALRPRLQGSRRPRARWRTRLVTEANLRFVRTMLLGRAPGLAAGPPVVGPFRPIVLQHRRVVDVRALALRTTLEGDRGVVSVDGEVGPIAPAAAVASATLVVTGPDGVPAATPLTLVGGRVTGRAVVSDASRWWPHTHGAPVLYDVRLRVVTDAGELTVDAGRVGFRELTAYRELEAEGLGLAVNGVPVFARGAVWTPLGASEERLRTALGHVVDAGMNMLRVPGIACYESARFHDLCDELGILVWQDCMFANFDYPESDHAFLSNVEREVTDVLDGLAHRPSLAVVCGGSEVAQQVAMLGLDPSLANGPLYGELLPRLVADARIAAPYVPSTPWGGSLPFRPDRGVANYYGVGAYGRPLADARRADVRFCGECLALANVPDEGALEGGIEVGGVAWKRGVQRDAGAGWDFDDVRDRYLALLHDVDPAELRAIDPERYRLLSAQLSGELMAETLGEWRRVDSPCAGALVLWLSDLRPGAGWGLLDHRGVPKAALHELRRALAPVAVWMVDEGLGGIDVHVANDRSEPLEAALRVALYRDREQLVEEATVPVSVAPHGAFAAGVEELLGRFVDVSWAYRFGPPAQDLVVASLQDECGTLLSQAFRHPIGPPSERRSAAALGLEATLVQEGTRLRIAARALAYGLRIELPGQVAADDAFSVEPGHAREIDLSPSGAAADGALGRVTALNLTGSVAIRPA